MGARSCIVVVIGLCIGCGAPESQPEEVAASETAPVDPCSLTTADMAGMSQEKVDRAWQACLDAQGYGPETEAVEHLRNAADCLDLVRGDMLGVFDPADRRPPRLVVDGVLRACGLAFNEYTGLSPEAEPLVVEAIERIRWTFQGLAAARSLERANQSLDNVILNLEGQAVRLENRAPK